MGGGTGTGGVETLEEVWRERFSGEELGDLFLYNYAGFLRRYDQAQSDLDALADKAKLFDEQAATYTEQVKGDVARYLFTAKDLSAVDINEVPFPEMWKDSSIRGIAGRSLAAKLRDDRKAAYNAFYIESGSIGQALYDNKMVRIEDVSDSKDTIQKLKVANHALVQDFRRRSPKFIIGRIMGSELLNGQYSGTLSIMDKTRWRRDMYDVGPIIDRDNGYIPNVKITFLDESKG